MLIEKVEYVLCQYELAQPIPLSCGQLTHRNFGLIRVALAGGVEGWGETSINFPPWTYRERAATIEEGLAPLLVGETVSDVLRLRDKMVDAMRPFTRMWAEGAIAQAISGVEMALWDALGKERGLPVANLLGEVQRTIFDCYATGINAADPAAGATDMVSNGYRAVKMRIGFDDVVDLQKARAVRDAVGPNIALLIDANQAFDLARATRMMEALQELDLYWLEEPVLSDDFEAQAELKRAFPTIPMAWGENAFRQAHFEHASSAGLADYIMPDPCRCGGMDLAIQAARSAARHDLPVSAHHYGSDLGFAAMLHFMAAAPLTDLVLRDVAPVPLRDAIVEEDFVPVDGKVYLPEGAGFGVTPAMDVIEQARVTL